MAGSLFQLKDTTLRTYLKKTLNLYSQDGDSPYAIERVQPFLIKNATKTITSTTYTILDTEVYWRYEVDTTAAAGDVTITLPLIANNYTRPVEIVHVRGGTYKVIIVPNASDSGKITADGLSAIWLPKVGDFMRLVSGATSGQWEASGENISSGVFLRTYAGYGSTDTKIVRFTTLSESYGNMFSENHSTGYSSNAKGLELTVNRSGIYAVTMGWYGGNGASHNYGISKNSTQLTTAVGSITAADRIAGDDTGVTNADSSGITIRLAKGDVIRPHTDGNTPYQTGYTLFRMEFIKAS